MIAAWILSPFWMMAQRAECDLISPSISALNFLWRILTYFLFSSNLSHSWRLFFSLRQSISSKKFKFQWILFFVSIGLGHESLKGMIWINSRKRNGNWISCIRELECKAAHFTAIWCIWASCELANKFFVFINTWLNKMVTTSNWKAFALSLSVSPAFLHATSRWIIEWLSSPLQHA